MKICKSVVVVLAATTFTVGCQTAAKQPAMLSSQADMRVLMSTLKTAMNNKSVAIGTGDPLKESRFTVLPRSLSPYETMSATMPTEFEIISQGNQCFIKKDGADETLYLLPDVTCSNF